MHINSKVRSLILILVVFALLFGVLFLVKHQLDRAAEDDDDGPGASDYLRQMQLITVEGKDYLPKEGITSYLMIGIDKSGKMADNEGDIRNRALCDFLLLVVFDAKAKTYSLIHLNRDTMTTNQILGMNGVVVDSRYEQLSYAHMYGSGMEDSCENVVKSVSDLLYGVPIQRYLALTMTAVGVLNDKLGGVDVTIPYDMTSVKKDWTPGKTVSLKGDDALLFIRARSSLGDELGTNAVRMERQRTYLSKMLQKVTEKNDSNFFFSVYNSVADYVLTNCTTNEINELSASLKDYSYAGITSPEGTAEISKVTGFNEFTVDERALRDLVLNTFYTPAD